MKKVRTFIAALAVAFAGTVVAVSPAHANHDNDFGHWNQPPLVVTPQWGLDSRIQDAAYYWQDNGFYRGYYPPLPAEHYSSFCVPDTGRIVVCETDRWSNALQGANGAIDPYYYAGDVHGHIRSMVVWIANDMGGNPLLRQITYRHEFGHALGMGHRGVGVNHGWYNTVMSPDANTPYADAIDADALADWQPPYHSH